MIGGLFIMALLKHSLQGVTAYSYGAPLESCKDMNVIHIVDSDYAWMWENYDDGNKDLYSFTMEEHSGFGSSVYLIRLDTLHEPSLAMTFILSLFMSKEDIKKEQSVVFGFMIQVRSVEKPWLGPLGIFHSVTDPHSNMKTMACNSERDTLTHSRKTSRVEAIWDPAGVTVKKVYAEVTVVEYFKSPAIRLKTKIVDLINVNISTYSHSLTSAPPTPETDAPKLALQSTGNDNLILTTTTVDNLLEDTTMETKLNEMTASYGESTTFGIKDMHQDHQKEDENNDSEKLHSKTEYLMICALILQFYLIMNYC